MSDQFVRVTDPATGYHRTAHQTEDETNKALKVLAGHDAVDLNGNPLPPKFKIDKGEPGSPATTKPGEGDKK